MFSAEPIIPMSTFSSFERLLNSFFRHNNAGIDVGEHFGEILMYQGVEISNEREFGREIFAKCSETCNWKANKKFELMKLIYLPISEGKEVQHELTRFFEITDQQSLRFQDFNLPNKTIFKQLKALNMLIKKEEKYGLYTPIDIGRSPYENEVPCEHFATIIKIILTLVKVFIEGKNHILEQQVHLLDMRE